MERNQSGLFCGMIVFAVIIAATSIQFFLSRPPDVILADAPLDEFSAERAALHLDFIASKKNPIGSDANADVREYITEQLKKLDVPVEVQFTDFFDTIYQRAANIGNVIARIPGTANKQAVLFMGHYDSVEDSYGASDNGAAVVTMLELIRLLQHHAPLQNDLIFLFTDGEEVGLLGAKAFLQEHPWAGEDYLVINLEARGTRGQSILFETGDNNYEIIKEFSRAVRYPAANSLSYEIYSRLPNDTDFSPFRGRGYQGLNFAYIDNAFDYHTGGDNIINTDLRSIQHHGSHAKSLALHLGNKSHDVASDHNAVYFNTFSYGFVYYPYSWVPYLMIITISLFIILVIIGYRKQKINFIRVVSGLSSFVIYMLLLYTIINSIYLILSRYYPGSEQTVAEFNLTYQFVIDLHYASSDIRLLEYNHKALIIGFAGIAIGFSLGFFRLILQGFSIGHSVAIFAGITGLLAWSGELNLTSFLIIPGLITLLFFICRKPPSLWEFYTGSLILWTFLMVFASIKMPGASYLFTWPLLFSMISVLIVFMVKSLPKYSSIYYGLLIFSVIPAIIWFPLLIYLFLVAMGLEMSGIAFLVSGLMMGLLIPIIDPITRYKPWLVPVFACLLGTVSLLYGSVKLEYNSRYRKQNNIIYATNGTTGQSFWLTMDNSTDQFTKQFLTDNPDTLHLKGFFPSSTNVYLAKSADLPILDSPAARVVSDTIIDDIRNLTLHIRSSRSAPRLDTFIKAGDSEIFIKVNDMQKKLLNPFRDTGWHILRYFALPEEGIKLVIYTDPAEQIDIRLTDFNLGMPDFAEYIDRSDFMMSRGDQSIATIQYMY